MDIVYYCKHCKSFVGFIDSSQTTEGELGFTDLTLEERQDLLQYDGVDHTLYVKTVCENCEAAFTYHPELLLSDTPLQ